MDIFGNLSSFERGLRSRVYENYYAGGSDHRLITGTLVVDPSIGEYFRNYPRPWNRWKLKKEAVVTAFRESLISSMDFFLGKIASSQNISFIGDAISCLILAALKSHVRSSGKGRRFTDFLKPELIQKEQIL